MPNKVILVNAAGDSFIHSFITGTDVMMQLARRSQPSQAVTDRSKPPLTAQMFFLSRGVHLAAPLLYQRHSLERFVARPLTELRPTFVDAPSNCCSFVRKAN
mmetsp:Transcript_10264/g.20940  ORF Transcript_10264/g.20940 Transcript_10264/m.20940 type:complete len:102 (+) Transcript_10264:510-815(+)